MSDIAPDTGTDSPVVTTGDLLSGQPDSGDLAAEVEKWKSLAREHENAWKKRAGDLSPERVQALRDAEKELKTLRAASMSDQEKAVSVARDEATREANIRNGGRLVAAEVKAAAAGRSVDVDALLEGLDASRFLDDDGEPKVKEIAAWVDRIAPPPDPNKRTFPDLGQGNRGNGNIALNDPLLKDLIAKVGPSNS